ncbi:hypothetical protein DFA_03916 [Cavenderia fasciculata]|uniref:Uncharacterized protein n=1 Tax=Cavenderia fasciculata TaxID=261658 RepID=F4Q0S1_CACFS|nr:uncharacterized protein DFA_03916 [Cavenderia fasciculata]EGG18422.1 hypothetical protein DFA_03916 [Cavenderia fasciculata]|eukprot:XP_004366326.1 hypothetical protein DFA_03916 [Cavenderia fasciculata]
MTTNNNNNNQNNSTSNSTVVIDTGDKQYTKNDFIKLLCLDEQTSAPTRYRFDSDASTLFFLANSKVQQKMNLHYVNLNTVADKQVGMFNEELSNNIIVYEY